MRIPYLTSENHQAKLREWHTALEPFEKYSNTFDVKKSALFVIDMQQYFLKEDSHAYVAPGPVVEKNIHALINSFHAKNRPVIFTYFAVNKGEPDPVGNYWKNPSFADGTPEARLAETLPREEKDCVLRKNSYSLFHAPDGEKLKNLLNTNGVQNIVICGVQTNLCCETAAREAFEAGLSAFVPMDGTATKSEDLHISGLKNMAYGFATVKDTEMLLKNEQ